MPSFSIRHLLWATAGCALLAIGIAASIRGSVIAFGLVMAPVVMLAPIIVLVMIYWLGNLFSRMLYSPIHSAQRMTLAESRESGNPSANRQAESTE